MIHPTPEQTQAAAQLAKRDDHLVVFLRNWLRFELERLPQAVVAPTLHQGRCQVLQELVKWIDGAPDTAAKTRPPGAYDH